MRSWVECLRPNPGARVRLFCLPYAGGSAQIFRGWPASLSPGVEVCAIQLPGRGAQLLEPPVDRLPVLVEMLAEAIGRHLDRPFAFYGHSMGAILAFELARRLRREGLAQPERLCVAAFVAPGVHDPSPHLHALPEAELKDELRRLDGTPREILEHEDLMKMVLPALRADFAVCETYEYTVEPPLDVPFSIFGGLDDDRVPREHLEAWGRQTRAGTILRMLPGGHFFMNTAQAALLEAISTDLQAGAAAVPGPGAPGS